MNTTVLKEIVALLFGRKYYANIVITKGTTEHSICSFIFPDKAAARQHRDELETNMSYRFVETISFRSRKALTKAACNKLKQQKQ